MRFMFLCVYRCAYLCIHVGIPDLSLSALSPEPVARLAELLLFMPLQCLGFQVHVTRVAFYVGTGTLS